MALFLNAFNCLVSTILNARRLERIHKAIAYVWTKDDGLMDGVWTGIMILIYIILQYCIFAITRKYFLRALIQFVTVLHLIVVGPYARR